ncbi:PAS domain-containing sensor histidine kinase [Desulfatitalea tepidiphila]|uniref:PAS domain-containing sensor histidine kinase n=1 Tax=Desulfatitalea tepidiphila TaxID=1185843 RepID=UPI0013791980|nr:histidine kinase [Desulfatitalea tepidiphila]
MKLLEQNQELYHLLFHQSPIGVYLYDKHLVITECNERFLSMIRSRRERIIGLDMNMLYDKRTLPAMRRALQGKLGVYEGPHRPSKKAPETWAYLRCAPLFDRNDEVDGGVAIIEDITRRKTLETKLQNSLTRMRQYSARIVQEGEKERARVAREIHDMLGQSLTCLKMDLEWMADRIGQPEYREKIYSMSKMVDLTIESMRKICTELRPSVLEELGLSAAVEWLAQDIENRTGLKIEVDCEDIFLFPDQATTVFRIIQEALTNICRHAKATKAIIVLFIKDKILHLEISDNGIGISEEIVTINNSLGLMGIRERVLLWNGTVHIKGTPGRGTSVSARIPVPESEGREV